MTKPVQLKSKLISPADFYAQHPLYKSLDLSGAGHHASLIRTFVGTFDAFCPKCRKESVFGHFETHDPVASEAVPQFHPAWMFEGNFKKVFTCGRSDKHTLTFYIHTFEEPVAFIKVGQFPSLADISAAGIQKYKSVLSAERFGDFTRAIGLISHGIGVGSFVYLRRIFESLIEDAHDEAKTGSAWDETAFKEGRMSDRILLLKDNLPEFLVSHAKMYGVLSRGIHSLSEDDCLGAFEPMKLGIELMLDEKIVMAQKKKKIADASQAIKTIADKHG